MLDLVCDFCGKEFQRAAWRHFRTRNGNEAPSRTFCSPGCKFGDAEWGQRPGRIFLDDTHDPKVRMFAAMTVDELLDYCNRLLGGSEG